MGYDVVVVGGGSAGCLLAARLSATRSVCLLEAGGVEGWPDALLDARVIPAAAGSRWIWDVPARLTADRTTVLVRGRALGGSSAVNGGYLVRATTADLQELAEVGGPLWSVEATTAACVRAEDDADLGGTPGHGSGGPVPVARTPAEQYHPVSAAVTAAALAAGYPAQPDLSAPGAHGVGPVPLTVRDGVRQNLGLAAAVPAVLRHGLVVRGDAVVRRVVHAHGRATGVELADGTVVDADEVVLSAGALASPALLARSGLGPHHVEGLSDHPELPLTWTPAVPVDGTHRAGLEVAVHPAGDELELRPYVAGFDRLVPGSGAPGDLVVGVAAMAPRGRGTLTVTDDGVHVDLAYLADPHDRAVLRDGVRAARALLLDGGVAGATAADEVADGPDAALDAWVAARLGTSQHTCGTAALGRTSASPVDERLRVRGVDGLRVVDGSVLPTVPRRGPHASVLMVAELAAHTLF
ncbi:mycofactocin system GMC family oxidoreductase MftG [Rhodococcus aerolatus]